MDHSGLRLVGWLLLLACLGMVGLADAACLSGDHLILVQPDGETVPVVATGDEYSHWFEDSSGYIVVLDVKTRVYCYAALSDDGARLRSTGISAHEAPPAGAARVASLPSAPVSDGRDAAKVNFPADHELVTTGDVRGITILVDFIDAVATVEPSEIDDLLNTLDRPEPSARDRFLEYSTDELDYTNTVSGFYIRADHPKSWYTAEFEATELVRQVIVDFDDHIDYSQYDSNDDGYVDALTIMVAGDFTDGLWPRAIVPNAPVPVDGVAVPVAALTYIGDDLTQPQTLAVWMHENGHSLLGWPDLYGVAPNNGVGVYCLMGKTQNYIQRPCAYLRARARWAKPVVLGHSQQLVPISRAPADIYMIQHRDVGNQVDYYIVENTTARVTGTDRAVITSGLAVWRIHETAAAYKEGNLSNENLVTLIQADGNRDLESGANAGDDYDLFRSSPDPAYDFPDFAWPEEPRPQWHDGGHACFVLTNIGEAADDMEFDVTRRIIRIVVDPQPRSLEASWHLVGPNGFESHGAGYVETAVPFWGSYTISWQAVPHWHSPAEPTTIDLEPFGHQSFVIRATYAAPFVAQAVGASGRTTGICVVDYDGDGDADLFVNNFAGDNELLVGDGSLGFAPQTAGNSLILAVADSHTAAWADVDGDADQDVVLVGGPGNLVIAENTGAGFVDRSQASSGFLSLTTATAAGWTSFDHAGAIDLLTVQHEGDNVLMLGQLEPGHDWPFLQECASCIGHARLGYYTLGARFGDFNNDRRPDVMLTAHDPDDPGVARPRLARNDADQQGYRHSGLFALYLHVGFTDARWEDFDGDTQLDLMVTNANSSCLLFRQDDTPDQADVVNSGSSAYSLVTADFDNDGHVDVYFPSRDEEDVVVFGLGDADFDRVNLYLPEVAGNCRAAACGDFNDDGLMDVAVGRYDDTSLVLINDHPDAGNWLKVRLVGGVGNRDGLGARITVLAGSLIQTREIDGGGSYGQSSKVAHFGLGDETTAAVTVQWTDGTTSSMSSVAVNQTVTLDQAEADGLATGAAAPRRTSLIGALTNPFNPGTRIAFELARPGEVRLAVYTVRGALVRVLLAEHRAAGRHVVSWDGSDLAGRQAASGVYLCVMKAGGERFTSKLALVK